MEGRWYIVFQRILECYAQLDKSRMIFVLFLPILYRISRLVPKFDRLHIILSFLELQFRIVASYHRRFGGQTDGQRQTDGLGYVYRTLRHVAQAGLAVCDHGHTVWLTCVPFNAVYLSHNVMVSTVLDSIA